MTNVKQELDQTNSRLTSLTNHFQEIAFEQHDQALEAAVHLIRTLQHELVFILDPENEWNPENFVSDNSVVRWNEHSIFEVERAVDEAENI